MQIDRFSFLGKIYYKIYYTINKEKCARKLGVKAGKNFHLYGKVFFGTEPWAVSLGDNVYLTDGVKFLCHDGGTLLFRSKIHDLEITKPIKLGNNVYVGNNVIFLPGVTIGDNVIIGAGSVVSKNIPNNSVAVGVPAKVIKTSEEYLEKIKKESLHLGNLKGRDKDAALRKYYKVN